jgi:hypothetical protein
MTFWGNGGSKGIIALMAKESAEDWFYAELIDFAFNRDGDLNSWTWNTDAKEPAAAPEAVVAAIRRLCLNSGEELQKFSDLQVAGGLKYIFNNAFSNYTFDLLDQEVSVDLRSSAFRSLNVLFANCFAPRCSHQLSQGMSAALNNPLNGACYMFWDTSPLSEGGLDALRVMENSLYLKNIACIESALHGLGHAFYKNEKYVETIINKFLAFSSDIDERLFAYAKAARTGYIQ